MEFIKKFSICYFHVYLRYTTFIGAIPRVTFEIHQYSSELLQLLFELLDQKSSGGKVSSAERKTIKQQQQDYQKSGGCIYCNIKVAGGIHFDEMNVYVVHYIAINRLNRCQISIVYC